MTFEQLSHFLAAAKYMNFSRAAQELFLHQSTISKSIAALEAELGGPLFLRQKSALVLTDAGRMLYNDAPMLQERFFNLGERVKRLNSGVMGALNLIYARGFAFTFADCYRKFRTSYPNVVWSARDCEGGLADLIWGGVLNNTADLGIIPHGQIPQDISGLCMHLLYQTRFAVAAPRGHPFYGAGSVRLADLSGQRILVTKGMKRDILIHMDCLLIGKDLPQLSLVDVDSAPNSPSTIEFLMMQVQAGYGLTIHCRDTLSFCGRGFDIVDIEDLGVGEAPFDIMLIWRYDNSNPALLRFIDCLEK